MSERQGAPPETICPSCGVTLRPGVHHAEPDKRCPMCRLGCTERLATFGRDLAPPAVHLSLTR